MEINLTILGGCFAVQNNIRPECLYHRIVKKEIEQTNRDKLNVNILRYERFVACIEKLENAVNNTNTDVLLFQVRTEQFLRISKLVYTFAGVDGKRKRTLTLPSLNKIPPENHDLLQMNLPLPRDNKERQKPWNKFKIHFNYSMGNIAGNRKYAFTLYDKLVSEIIDFCLTKKIKLIIIGPGSRPHLKIENEIAWEMHYHFKKIFCSKNIPYISLIGETNDKNESLFFDNGIHVNEKGHKRAADMLLEKLEELFPILLLSSRAQDRLIYT